MNPLDRLGRHPRSGAEVVLVGFSGALRSAVVGFAPREVLCCALDEEIIGLHRPQEELSDDTAPNNRPSVERVMRRQCPTALPNARGMVSGRAQRE